MTTEKKTKRYTNIHGTCIIPPAKWPTEKNTGENKSFVTQQINAKLISFAVQNLKIRFFTPPTDMRLIFFNRQYFLNQK